MVTLHETEVDGVRCFWVETGRPTLAAQLIFRQGMADEPLRESGWLHLIEHLALHGRDRHPLEFNGSVSSLTTTFDAHGPADLVAAHLTGVTGWLSAPTFEELERERNVLRAEAELRGGPSSRALGWRYGARGPGVTSYFEPALEAADPDRLKSRAAGVFTRGNTVLALDGPPPAGLRLDLPDGDLQPAGEAIPCEKTPAAYVEPAGLVVSGVVTRGHSATFVPDLLRQALTDRLRHQGGGSYAPWATYERVDEERAVVIAGSDVATSARGNLAGATWSLLKKLAADGAHGTQLSDLISLRRQALHDPYGSFGLAVQAAHAAVNGRPAPTFDELVAELDSTSSDDVQSELVAFHDSLLIGMPAETTWSEQWPLLEQPTTSPRIQGHRYRSANWPAVKDRLVIGDEGVELTVDDHAHVYPMIELEGVVAFEDGARFLVRRDGYSLTLEPTLWRRGDQAVASFDERLDHGLRLPHPRREPPPDLKVLSAGRRWGIAARRMFPRGWRRVGNGLVTLGIFVLVLTGLWPLLLAVVPAVLAGNYIVDRRAGRR